MSEFAFAGKRVWVAGHSGMVGQALMRRLAAEECEILTVGHAELDLKRQSATEDWLAAVRPDAVFVAAATVGGIGANSTRPAEFLFDNLAIAQNVIEGARRAGVGKLLYLGSSCIYPRMAPQPMAEDALLTGPLEPTNEPYAIAKIAGIKLCQAYRRQYGCDFISAMPTNLYGPHDNYNLQSGHVVAALIAKIHAAVAEGRPTVELWGTGKPLREFLSADDLADGLVFLMKTYSGAEHVNIGTGHEVTIAGLAQILASILGFTGDFRFDPSRPDGTPRKVMDTRRMAALGWRAPTTLKDGLTQACAWYVDHLAAVRH